MFRSYRKFLKEPTGKSGLIQTSERVKILNEDCVSHSFIERKQAKFDAQAFDVSGDFPKLPQTLELVNQTVSIPTEPIVENYTMKNILEFKDMDEARMAEFHQALNAFQDLKVKQSEMAERLTVKEPKIIMISPAPKMDDTKMMRSSIGLNTTGVSGQSPQGSEINLNQSFSGSVKLSPRARRSTRHLTLDQRKALEEKSSLVSQVAAMNLQEQRDATDIPLDKAGMQLFENTLELNFMQKL